MIRSVDAWHVAMAMGRSFGHAHAVRRMAESVVVCVDAGEVIGAGESVPREYVTGETIDGVLSALAALDWDEAVSTLSASTFEEAARRIEALSLPKRLRRGPVLGLSAACATELALLDAAAKRFGRSSRDLAVAIGLEPARPPGSRRYGISRVLDSTRSPEDFLQTITSPPHHVKIKVGLGPEEDVARVAAVRKALGAAVPISVDANMAWSSSEAEAMIARLAPYGVAWYEEPLEPRAFREYRELRERTGQRVMLDESLCSIDDARAALEARACDLWNVRISKVGGPIAALRMAALASREGVGVQIGVQVGQMGVLAAADRQLAAMLPAIVAFESSGPDRLFDEQIVDPPVTVDRQTWLCDDLPGPGLGVELRRDVVERHAKRHVVLLRRE